MGEWNTYLCNYQCVSVRLSALHVQIISYKCLRDCECVCSSVHVHVDVSACVSKLFLSKNQNQLGS